MCQPEGVRQNAGKGERGQYRGKDRGRVEYRDTAVQNMKVLTMKYQRMNWMKDRLIDRWWREEEEGEEGEEGGRVDGDAVVGGTVTITAPLGDRQR